MSDEPFVVLSLALSGKQGVLHNTLRTTIAKSTPRTHFVLHLCRGSALWWLTERMLLPKWHRLHLNPETFDCDLGTADVHASNVRLVGGLWALHENTRIVFLNSVTKRVALLHGWEAWILQQTYRSHAAPCSHDMWWEDGAHLPLQLVRHSIGAASDATAWWASACHRMALAATRMVIQRLDVEMSANSNATRDAFAAAASAAMRAHPDTRGFSLNEWLLPMARKHVGPFDTPTSAAGRGAGSNSSSSPASHPCVEAQAKAVNQNCLGGGWGYPDCVKVRRGYKCKQQKGAAMSIKVALVGDSLTAGVAMPSSGVGYAPELQATLGSRFAITNLGASSAMLTRPTDLARPLGAGTPFRSYWTLGQLDLLNSSTWDAAVIMIGTNDCSRGTYDVALGRQCKAAMAHGHRELLVRCPFARAYADLVALIRSRGQAGREPVIFIVIPPPVVASCDSCACGVEDNCVNTLLPQVVAGIHQQLKLPRAALLRAYEGVVEDYARRPFACSLLAPQPAAQFCRLYQCDRIHPSPAGGSSLASTVATALRAFET